VLFTRTCSQSIEMPVVSDGRMRIRDARALGGFGGNRIVSGREAKSEEVGRFRKFEVL